MVLAGFGVTAVVMVVTREGKKDEHAVAPTGSIAPTRPASASELERPPAAPAPPPETSRSKAEFAAAVVIPPELARKFEKQYRDLPPKSLELAHAKLKQALLAETQKHAPEDALLALRREIAWLDERRPREE